MLVVIDIGNTRTKWAEVSDDGSLTECNATSNATIAQSALKNSLLKTEKVVVANVAGEAMAQQLMALIPSDVNVHFVQASAEACHVVNGYQQSDALGVDRWAAAIAAWHQYQQPAIVINAGTAITIDSLSNTALKTRWVKSASAKRGFYLGGSIMPGLYLMYDALLNHTAKLSNASAGTIKTFPVNTNDGIQTGCMNAVIGAILLASKQLEKHCAFLPKFVITGGDAGKIAHALRMHLKKVEIEDHLVLQGLVLLEKDSV